VGVGAITESDLKLAQEFGGIIYSFNASFPDSVRRSATFLKVPVKEFNVIYALIDDLKQEISQKLPPEDVEVQVSMSFSLLLLHH
jgi:translation initiation factor IF-2